MLCLDSLLSSGTDTPTAYNSNPLFNHSCAGRMLQPAGFAQHCVGAAQHAQGRRALGQAHSFPLQRAGAAQRAREALPRRPHTLGAPPHPQRSSASGAAPCASGAPTRARPLRAAPDTLLPQPPWHLRAPPDASAAASGFAVGSLGAASDGAPTDVTLAPLTPCSHPAGSFDDSEAPETPRLWSSGTVAAAEPAAECTSAQNAHNQLLQRREPACSAWPRAEARTGAVHGSNTEHSNTNSAGVSAAEPAESTVQAHSSSGTPENATQSPGGLHSLASHGRAALPSGRNSASSSAGSTADASWESPESCGCVEYALPWHLWDSGGSRGRT